MQTKKTLDQALVRELNLSSTLRLIHNEAPLVTCAVGGENRAEQIYRFEF